MKRVIPVLLVCFIGGLIGAVTPAAEVPFNPQQFKAAEAAGKPVAVAFHAKWCSTCREQAAALTALMGSPELKALTLYVADFDRNQALRRSLSVTTPSTIVVFKGSREIARTVGDTKPKSLMALLRRALT